MRRTSMLAVSLLALLGAAVAPAAAQTDETRVITFHGYSNFEFEYSPSDVGRGDRNGSFDAQEFDPVVVIKPIDRLRVVADLRWEHGPSTEDAVGNVALEYGFAEYRLSDALALRAGKMLTPFGIYNEIHNAAPAFLSYKAPLTTNKPEKMGAERRYFPRWGAGIQAVGNLKLGAANADYNLLVANGSNDAANPFEQDDNLTKSVTARFRISPLSGLKLGASYFQDLLNVYASGKDTGVRRHQRAYGASLEWNPGREGVEVEWVHGSLDPSLTVPKVRGNAIATVLSHRLGGGFTPYFRFQYFDPNNTVSDDVVKVLSPGLNINIKQTLFLKLQGDRTLAGAKNTRFKGQDFTELVASISVAF
jgi:opacity protein-like surface antigen